MAIYKTGPSRHEIAPSLNLDFANTKKLDPRITFTRTSTATYYDGVTHEKAEENLFVRSQDLTNNWNSSALTRSGDTETAPDGTTTADTITDNATSAGHNVFQDNTSTLNIQANTTYTLSCFMKAGTFDHGYLAITDRASGASFFAAEFDLTNGTVDTAIDGTSGTLDSSSITSVGNGWYRCVITGEVATVASTTAAMIGISDGTTAMNTSFGVVIYSGSGDTIHLWGAQLEQRSSVTAYTPTTDQPITNYIPALQTAASGEARFDHNPTTGESLGLLIEEQRTNLVTYSSEFNNADWDGTVSITANTIVAPDGTLTGDTADIEGNEFIYQTCSVSASTVYTASWYIKAGTATEHRLAFYDESNLAFIEIFDYNITDGDNVGNGWYRYSRQVTTPVGCTALRVYPLRYGASGHQGTSFLWGAQLEEGSFPTSYIATSGSQVTRNADSASMTGDNFSSWYRQDEGSVYWEFNQSSTGTTEVLGGTSNGSFDNTIYFNSPSATGLQSFVRYNNAIQTGVGSNSYDKGSNSKLGFAYAFNDLAFSLDGAVPSTDTVANIPSQDRLVIGSSPWSVGGNPFGGTIKKLAYYPARLPDGTLVALTED